MAAGDISKKLAFKIRDIIGDLSKKRIKNDVVIYDLIFKYQLEFMITYNTTRELFTITLTTATEYALDATVNKITRIFTPEAQTTDYVITLDEFNRKIVLDDSVAPVVGEIIYYEAYLKPTVGLSKTVDPVIGTDYEPYLIDAVLTHFPTEGVPQTVADIDEIRARVRDFASRRNNLNRFSGNRAKGGTIQSLNFY